MPSVIAVTVAVSVAGLTIRASVIAGLAIVALLLAGWRKPARAEPRSHRVAHHTAPSPRQLRRARGIPVEHHPTPLYRPPGPARRLVAAAASGGIGLLVGVLTAIVLAYAAAFSVVWMTNLLER